MKDTAEVLHLKNNPDSTNLSEVVKQYDIPATHAVDGVRVPLSPVVVVDPSSDPARLVPQGWWLYQARRVNTSGGAGALVTRIQMNPGQVGILVQAYVAGPASAGATLTVRSADEDAAWGGTYVVIGAGANNSCTLPSIGTTNLSNNSMNTLGLLIAPGEFFIAAASTSLLNETLTTYYKLLLSKPDIPLWDITGSVGGSALAASTISAANTLQKVDLPW